MSAAAVSPPTVLVPLPPLKPDPMPGFKSLQQPINLSATSPLLANGTPLTSQDQASGTYTLDAATAAAGFTFGALLYRSTSGVVEIFDGNASWLAQAAFDPSSSTLKPALFAFDPKTGKWTGVFMLSSSPDARQASFPTAASGTPKYGFIALFTTPKATSTVTPTTAVRSPLGTPFGVIAADPTQRVQPGLVQGLSPTQDPKSADGFVIVVNDKNQVRVADLIVSSDTGLSQVVAVHFYSGGVMCAGVALEPTGNVHLTSTTQVTLDAPVIEITGTLKAQHIQYLPYAPGSTETFL
jgi:hypothetical protein